MKKTKNYILIFIIFIFFYNCKSIDIENKKQSKIEKKIYEKIEDLSFVNFNYTIDTEESKIKQNDIYEIKYLIDFKFKYKNNNFKVSYILYDEKDNIIFKKDNLKPQNDISDENIYFVKDYFKDIINYQKIKYHILAEINNKEIEYTGEYKNLLIPYLKNFSIGPIISNYINKKLNVSLSINLKLINYKGIKWIRLIPPSHDSYWNINFKVDYLKNEAVVNNIVYEDSKNFIENGKYLIQLNLNRYGLIQKEVEIIDISGNNNGENYGLPIVNVLDIDKKKIKLETLLLDKIEYLEILFYDKEENKKIGSAKIKPKEEIFIDYLITQIKDDNKKSVKIEYNKDYEFKIYSYSKEINGIKYISISDNFIIKIKKFKLLPF